MKKGYFFSLEVLIAILIILSSLFIYSASSEKTEHKDKRIYEALDLLEKQNRLNSGNLEEKLENILDFDIGVSESCNKLKYMLTENSSTFRTINVCY